MKYFGTHGEENKSNQSRSMNTQNIVRGLSMLYQ